MIFAIVKLFTIATSHWHTSFACHTIQQMEDEQPQIVNSVRVGVIEIVDPRGADGGDGLLLRHHGKTQIVEVVVSAAALERWALRQLREQVFA